MPHANMLLMLLVFQYIYPSTTEQDSFKELI